MNVKTLQVFKNIITANDGLKFNKEGISDIRNISMFYDTDVIFSENDTKITWYNKVETLNFNHNDLNILIALIREKDSMLDLNNSNHYKWLETNLEEFWFNVFGKSLQETNCAGIISAHADKCYCYKKQWLKEEIPFFHGVALYLLTYTKEFGNNSKEDSMQWVIDNYLKYLNNLPKIMPSENVTSDDDMAYWISRGATTENLSPTQIKQYYRLKNEIK